MLESESQPPSKLLFICSRNKIRSLTAEKLFQPFPGCQVRSAGTRADARVVVTPGHVGWADLIVVMEKSHLKLLRQKFGDLLSGKPVVCLNIPDEFTFMQPELVDELLAAMASHMEFPEDFSQGSK